MARTVPLYPPEFKIEAVQLVQQGERSLTQSARGCPLGCIGVSEQILRNWVKQIEIDSGVRAGLTTEERDELRRLRRENRILKEERAILKKRQPSSPGRATRSASGLRVHRGGEGASCGDDALPVARRVAQRLLRVAHPTAVHPLPH